MTNETLELDMQMNYNYLALLAALNWKIDGWSSASSDWKIVDYLS